MKTFREGHIWCECSKPKQMKTTSERLQTSPVTPLSSRSRGSGIGPVQLGWNHGKTRPLQQICCRGFYIGGIVGRGIQKADRKVETEE